MSLIINLTLPVLTVSNIRLSLKSFFYFSSLCFSFFIIFQLKTSPKKQIESLITCQQKPWKIDFISKLLSSFFHKTIPIQFSHSQLKVKICREKFIRYQMVSRKLPFFPIKLIFHSEKNFNWNEKNFTRKGKFSVDFFFFNIDFLSFSLTHSLSAFSLL